MSAAFLPSASDELNFDANGLPDTLRPAPPEGHVVDEFVVQHLHSLHHEQATFKTAVATTVQMLIGQVKAVSDKCEAITTENARLAGKMDTVLALLSTRTSPATLTPSPLPPFMGVEISGEVTHAVPVAATPVAANRTRRVYADGRVEIKKNGSWVDGLEAMPKDLYS